MKAYGQKLKAWDFYWSKKQGEYFVWLNNADPKRARQEGKNIIEEQLDEIEQDQILSEIEALEEKYDSGDWTYEYWLEWQENE